MKPPHSVIFFFSDFKISVWQSESLIQFCEFQDSHVIPRPGSVFSQVIMAKALISHGAGHGGRGLGYP